MKRHIPFAGLVGIWVIRADAAMHGFKLVGLSFDTIGVGVVAAFSWRIGDAVDISAVCIGAVGVGIGAITLPDL